MRLLHGVLQVSGVVPEPQAVGPARVLRRPQAQPPATKPAPPAGVTPKPPATTPPDAQQQPPRIRTGINYVRVDVIVTDRDGNAVLDLTADDFTVSEDGKPQKVDSFSIVGTNLDRRRIERAVLDAAR